MRASIRTTWSGVLLPGGEMSLQFQVGEGELGVAVEQDAAVHE
ncbi:MAG: hypothetical protein Q3Y13_00020 [Sutterella sp.]|nr:hypothetical protein [Sutterella sp.]